MREAIQQFIRNAWEPIAVPRWMISTKYALFFVVGLIAFFDGIETLNLATPTGYEPVWSLVVGVSGVIAFLGSLRPRWGWLEAVGAAFIVVFLAVLTFLMFARGSNAVGALLVIVNLLPAVRAVFLIVRISLSFSRREEWIL